MRVLAYIRTDVLAVRTKHRRPGALKVRERRGMGVPCRIPLLPSISVRPGPLVALPARSIPRTDNDVPSPRPLSMIARRPFGPQLSSLMVGERVGRKTVDRSSCDGTR